MEIFRGDLFGQRNIFRATNFMQISVMNLRNEIEKLFC